MLKNDDERIWKLYYVSILTSKTANIAFKILKDYNLLKNRETLWSETVGERPKKIRRKIDKWAIQRNFERLEWLLNQNIEFRDALKTKITSKTINK